MLNPPVHLPDHAGGLEPSAFQIQLRRLESLQTLMTQGGAVVGEVAHFLAKAREELSVFQREQEAYAGAQQRLLEEKSELAARLIAAEKAAESAALQVKEYELRVAHLSTQLSLRPETVSREEFESERKRHAEERAAAAEKIAALEAALLRERGVSEQALGKVRRDEASLYGTEIALLKERLSALEQQLEAERERRARLMEVVKVHDVTVVAQKQRQPA